jgi:predicted transcriptional regulator
MNAEDLDALRREHQQWEIEQIQAALRDAGCGRFVEHAKVRNVLSIETNPELPSGATRVVWAERS